MNTLVVRLEIAPERPLLSLPTRWPTLIPARKLNTDLLPPCTKLVKVLLPGSRTAKIIRGRVQILCEHPTPAAAHRDGLTLIPTTAWNTPNTRPKCLGVARETWKECLGRGSFGTLALSILNKVSLVGCRYKELLIIITILQGCLSEEGAANPL